MIEKLRIKKKEINFEWDNNKVSFQSGFLAPQAEGNVVVKFDGIEFLTAATINKHPDVNRDFMPLMVDFREMFYSAGKIGGAPYRRKEGRPSDDAVLISRIVDRSLRPMFPSGMVNDVILTINTLQIDKDNFYAVPAIISASLSMMVAGIDFEGPVGAVRIGYQDGRYIINPKKDEIGNMNLVIAGTKDTVTMIESAGEDIPTDILIKAIDIAQEQLKIICDKQEEFMKQFNKEKIKATKIEIKEEIFERAQQLADEYENKFFPTNKKEFGEIYDKIKDKLNEEFEDEGLQINVAVFKSVKKVLRRHLLRTGNRIDGRNPSQVRPLYTEVGLFDRTHGTGLFQRGETQVLSFTTLGAPGKVLLQDTLEKNDEEERFMHHYYMLPFSTNEARGYRGQSRREIGHGFLAEKALRPILPEEKDFPYTIRIASEALSSNGSTSMASVCAGCLSMMDAGIPIKKPVSGIAMGLVIEKLTDKEIEEYTKENKYLKIVEIDSEKYGYIILTDLQGQEDFTGDMDFKVAGSKDSINALQMDMKVKGLPTFVLQQAIEQANIARAEILDFMLKTLPEPRREVSPYAPSITVLKLQPSDVRKIIGKGGETIKDIIDQTGVAIDFDDDGTTVITAENSEGKEKAIQLIQDLVWEPKKGEKIKGKITRIESYGLFVDLGKGKTGLCHVKSFKDFIEDLSKKYKVGEDLEVEISDIGKDGKIQIKTI